MEPLVNVFTGKQGRTNANKPAHELLRVHKPLPMDSEYLANFQIDEITEKVQKLLETHHGHDFTAEYMAEHDGSNKICAITIDDHYNVHAVYVPLFRPTSHGGHVLFRSGKEIESIIKITHSLVPIEQAGSMELGLFVSKFKGIDCLLIAPDTLETPELYRALNLETIGDGTDTTALVYLRLCDKLGLGRSPPHVSIGKFKFLFPGVELDTSQVKSNKSSGKKRAREIETPPPPPPRSVYTVINDMIDESGRAADSHAKDMLYRVAKKFIRSFYQMLGPEMFDDVFIEFIHLPSSIVLETMGNMNVITNIIDSNIGCPKTRISMIHSIEECTR